MKIHEYQAKDIFRRYDIAVPYGRACFSLDDVKSAIAAVPTDIKVVKAQIHAGGRGKGGGVCVAKSADAIAFAERLLGSSLITPQTGPAGQRVRRLLVESGANIAGEWYISLVVDRDQQQVVLMASSEGGTEIETVAATTPEKIHKLWINPKNGVEADAAAQLASSINLPANVIDDAVSMIEKLYHLFVDIDASLLEINPLVVTTEGQLLALDGKINLDDNALFRHPDNNELRDWDEESTIEAEAAKHDLSYIALEGNIGCMVNGAGLAMATMDIIQLYGGQPANFLDVGGSATTEKVTTAFKLMLTNPDVRAILINIFGGIMQCDIIADGVSVAARQVGLSIPLVVRLEGTNVEQGKAILDRSGLSIVTATTMADAAEKVVQAACR